MKQRARLEGSKAIAYFISQLLNRPYSRGAVSYAAHPHRAEPLPVHYDHGGFIWAFEDEIEAHVKRQHRRRHVRRATATPRRRSRA